MSADDQNGSIGPNSDVTTPHVLVTPRRLGHSFRNGIQQDMTRERLAQIGDAPGIHRLIACGRVVVRRHEDDRHFDPDTASRRSSSIPETPLRWMPSSRQVAVCALPLSNNASAEANVQLSMPLCANSRTTPLRKPALSIDHDHDCQSALPYPCPAPVRYVWPTLDLDQRNLVRRWHGICRKLFTGRLAATAWASY
jgi:hypothetical protein